MKKYKLFLVFALLLLVASPAFAFSSKDQQGLGSDEVWTTVTLSPGEESIVSSGTVLVYDSLTNDVDRMAREVRVATASADGVRIAGIAQRTIVSDESALILQRGLGYAFVATSANITSGDALFVSIDASVSPVTSTTQRQVGFATQTQAGTTAGRTKARVYLTLV